ncbi:unnamed protein product [Linum trigynum]|uniref:DUF3741 domain-containing protein n=1 Tax=Linum trigynum TaxID=586398 RepID=A0AAV2CJM5_9ROSI
MAKRSDFAQKLLDDLRVRKERMAASHHHQNSRGSRPVASNSYAYTKPTSRSSRDMRTQQTAGIRTAAGHNRHSSSNRSISMENNSKQLVPVRRGQQQNHHQQVGDLTMALTFAIENGAKLGRMDAPGSRSMLNFLHQISRRSVDWGNMQKASNIDIHFSSSSHLPALSNHHIREISKGAQRLNQILRACSNGHNIDTYSVEIGKELLKGAMDLQESLRMLVNLQEGSDYTVTPQRKGRIKLLDEEGEEEDDDEDEKAIKGAIQMKQIALPRFSFDRRPSKTPSTYTKEITRSDLKQRVLMALPYASEDPEKVSDVGHSTIPSHKRSSSRVSSVRNPTVTETRNQSSASKPKPEKKRISNVVAKLMGMEELPENEDVVDGTMEKEASSMKKSVASVVTSPEKGNENRRKKKDVENLVPPPPPGRKQKQVMQEETSALQSEQNDRRKIHNDAEGIKPMRGSNMANMKIDKQQSNYISSQLNRSVKEIGEKYNNAEVKRGQKVDDFEDMIPRHDQYQLVMVPQSVRGSESAITWPAQTEFKVEKRGANKQISSNRVKESQNQHQPSLAKNLDSKDMKQQKTQMKRQETSQRIQAAPRGKSHIQSEDTTTKRVGHNTSNGDLEPARSSATAIVHKQDSRSRNLNENFPSKDQKSDNTTNTKKRTPFSGSGKEEKIARLPATEVKTPPTRAQKVETARRIDELADKRRGASQKLPKPPLMKRQASSTFPQKKQRGVDKKLSAAKETNKERSRKLKDPKVQLVKSEKPAASIQQAYTSKEPQTETGEALYFQLHDDLSDDGASLRGPELPIYSENIVSTEIGKQEDQDTNNAGSDEHESQPNVSDSVKEDQPLNQEDQNVSQQKPLAKPLTEAENLLKQILVKNQRFLDTAEALFLLNIPIEILNVVCDAPDFHNQESRLTADCGYEVMKRKGKRQELLRTHRYTKLRLKSTENLDDLIKQLCNDLEKLRLYGRNGNAESGIEDYLPKMLEADVCNSEPDVNSMWEIGWEKADLKFPEEEEVIRGVEKQVLNGLLDEVVGDFLAVF